MMFNYKVAKTDYNFKTCVLHQYLVTHCVIHLHSHHVPGIVLTTGTQK
jgi:hypothetical protein